MTASAVEMGARRGRREASHRAETGLREGALASRAIASEARPQVRGL